MPAGVSTARIPAAGEPRAGPSSLESESDIYSMQVLAGANILALWYPPNTPIEPLCVEVNESGFACGPTPNGKVRAEFLYNS